MVPLLEYQEHFVTDKNVLVTGCTSGIGEALVYSIAELRPHKIFLACRSHIEGEPVKQKLNQKGIASQILVGNLSSKAGSRQIADAMLATKEPLHVLISNAGVRMVAQSSKVLMSEELGLEQHFMTNYFSMVILCTALKQLLEESAPSRIVITGSSTHMSVARGKANLDDLQFEQGWSINSNCYGDDLDGSYVQSEIAYAQSKLLQYMWVKKFATTVGPEVAVMIYNPGQCKTHMHYELRKMVNCCFPFLAWLLGMREAKDGARVALWCVDSPEGASANGKYIDFGSSGPLKMNPPCELAFSPSHNKFAESIMDPRQVERLWTLTQNLLMTL